jgi:hypothetical protein
MVQIGVLGIELRVARFPQFYLRIGFVHGFRPPDEAQIMRPLSDRWLPTGMRLHDTRRIRTSKLTITHNF